MKDNFIEISDNALSDDNCQSLSDEFDYQHSIGNTYQSNALINGKEEKSLLDCIDLSLSVINDKNELLNEQIFYHIDDSMLYFLKSYQDRYHVNPYFLNIDAFDPANLKTKKITDFPLEGMPRIFDRSQVIIRKFESDKNHAQHAWSTDWKNTSDAELFRTLSIIFFLNDVKEGGEVEFYHQNMKIKPKKGRIIIFPSVFTHLYKINKPVDDNMYMVKTWIKIN